MIGDLTGEGLSNLIDMIGLRGSFVGSIALDASEPQREPSWVLATALQLIEGDLDHQLRADMDNSALAAKLARKQLLFVNLNPSAVQLVLEDLSALHGGKRLIEGSGDRLDHQSEQGALAQFVSVVSRQ